MILCLRNTKRYASWLTAMLFVQALDWIATILAVEAGKVTLTQAGGAAFLPVLFMIVLGFELRRQSTSLAAEHPG
jgi:hypothetical protein